jgi:hypothetical protein
MLLLARTTKRKCRCKYVWLGEWIVTKKAVMLIQKVL